MWLHKAIPYVALRESAASCHGTTENTLYENYKHELTISNRALTAKAAIVVQKVESIYFSEDKNIGHAIT